MKTMRLFLAAAGVSAIVRYAILFFSTSRKRYFYLEKGNISIFCQARERSYDDFDDRRGSTLRSGRGAILSQSGRESREPRAGSLDPMDRYADFCKGMKVEARYLGHGAWYEAKVVDVNPDRSVNVVYNDGEIATRLHPSTVRRAKEGILMIVEFYFLSQSEQMFLLYSYI